MSSGHLMREAVLTFCNGQPILFCHFMYDPDFTPIYWLVGSIATIFIGIPLLIRQIRGFFFNRLKIFGDLTCLEILLWPCWCKSCNKTSKINTSHTSKVIPLNFIEGAGMGSKNVERDSRYGSVNGEGHGYIKVSPNKKAYPGTVNGNQNGNKHEQNNKLVPIGHNNPLHSEHSHRDSKNLLMDSNRVSLKPEELGSTKCHNLPSHKDKKDINIQNADLKNKVNKRFVVKDSHMSKSSGRKDIPDNYDMSMKKSRDVDSSDNEYLQKDKRAKSERESFDKFQPNIHQRDISHDIQSQKTNFKNTSDKKDDGSHKEQHNNGRDKDLGKSGEDQPMKKGSNDWFAEDEQKGLTKND